METRRPTIPAAEEILGGYFPVLDHGFVALVDYMGSDEDVERAARVSYGFGTRKVSQTRGLIRYLRRHRHTTPSEMVELKFHCAMPMFVARQWIRHRTACLAEGTEVYFDLPGGIRKGSRLCKLPIEDIWRRFRPTRNRTRSDEQRNPYLRRDRVRGMRVRQVDEETTGLRHTRVVDVFRNGPKPVFRMMLADGKTIEATADHRFLFADGWGTLSGRFDLREIGGRAAWKPADCRVRVIGESDFAPALPRDDEVPGEELEPVGQFDGPTRRASQILRTRPRWRPRVAGAALGRSTLVSVDRFEYVGVKETYDLEVEGPFHNFIANGIVTHNSVNEYSARYSLMPLLFYMPEAEHLELQSRSNQQGREGVAPAEVYREAVRRWEEIRRGAGEGYGWMIEQDVARELARIDLPLSTYTQWYWKVDLHNLLHFLTLRVDPHAQWEIREYARIMAGMLQRVAPLSFEAWVDYDLAGQPFSRGELEALSRLLEADDAQRVAARPAASVSAEELAALGLSKREVREFVGKLRPTPRPDFALDLSAMRSAEDVATEMEEAVPGAFE